MTNDLILFTSAGITEGTEITLHPTDLPEDGTVSLLFGHERITLDFYDPETLDRLSTLAQEGARRLRATAS